MRSTLPVSVVLAAIGAANCFADSPVLTPRPVPATRLEMKQLLEEMKKRPYRISLPEFAEQEKAKLGERALNYESRLRLYYIPEVEGTVFGGYNPRTAGTSSGSRSDAKGPRGDFTRNADENMTLTYPFKTMLFWIVSRTNNCQYCLGHQEWKLSAAGMKDDAIAALDSDWSSYSKKDQAAFAYARTLTYEPHQLSDDTIARVKQHFTPLQILEMTMSMSWNNAINRWKEGIGIPQSSSNSFGGRTGSQHAATEHSDSFTTPTSDKYKSAISIVAPLEIINGKPSGRVLSTRPNVESRDEVKARIAQTTVRIPRLPLVDESVTQAWLKDAGQQAPVTCWMRLIANFPSEARSRLPSLLAREKQTGELTQLQKAQINWIIARQDRAWYAVGRAYKQLASLGQSEDQIFALDGDWKNFSEADRSLLTFAKHLAASPIAATDQDAASALQHTGPALLVQTINHVASGAYFHRVTEAAGLAVEP